MPIVITENVSSNSSGCCYEYIQNLSQLEDNNNNNEKESENGHNNIDCLSSMGSIEDRLHEIEDQIMQLQFDYNSEDRDNNNEGNISSSSGGALLRDISSTQDSFSLIRMENNVIGSSRRFEYDDDRTTYNESTTVGQEQLREELRLLKSKYNREKADWESSMEELILENNMLKLAASEATNRINQLMNQADEERCLLDTSIQRLSRCNYNATTGTGNAVMECQSCKHYTLLIEDYKNERDEWDQAMLLDEKYHNQCMADANEQIQQLENKYNQAKRDVADSNILLEELQDQFVNEKSEWQLSIELKAAECDSYRSTINELKEHIEAMGYTEYSMSMEKGEEVQMCSSSPSPSIDDDRSLQKQPSTEEEEEQQLVQEPSMKSMKNKLNQCMSDYTKMNDYLEEIKIQHNKEKEEWKSEKRETMENFRKEKMCWEWSMKRFQTERSKVEARNNITIEQCRQEKTHLETTVELMENELNNYKTNYDEMNEYAKKMNEYIEELQNQHDIEKESWNKSKSVLVENRRKSSKGKGGGNGGLFRNKKKRLIEHFQWKQ